MAGLRFEAVGKRYPDGTLALANVDLDVRDGEFLVLVGPSGCGKSTLLRSAAGLEELTAGRVMIGERDVTRMAPGDRDIAMVFQNYALYPHMDVYENMAFGLGQRGVPKAVIRQKIEKAARTLDLVSCLKRKPGQLSGGQRQRVAMGRAIVRDPQCFLMDEPLSNLDAKLRVQMRAELKLLNAELGVTTLYVTHDQIEAMTMGDRVAVLRPVGNDGQSNLQQCAAPRELYENPVNLFVAAFIGSPAMNLLEMRLVQADEGLRFEHQGAGVRLSVPPSLLGARPALEGRVGQDLVIGIRPEAFRLVQGDAPGALGGKVVLTELTGADAYLFFELAAPPVQSGRVDGEDAPPGHGAVTRVTVRVEPARLPARGAEVRLDVDMDRVHVFDPKTGQAIV